MINEKSSGVVIFDTLIENAGDGDIPHPGIGRARRMQVRTPALQHAVMIEAVENHMPQCIVIDEIGIELEAAAARTIAERGVQLVATAHGTNLDNLLVNPTLSDLVGGIQTVTLSDEEARRRGTQKSVLEREAPPTFRVLVEIQAYQRVAIYHDVAQTVDAVLLGMAVAPELRERGVDGELAVSAQAPSRAASEAVERRSTPRLPVGNGAGMRETVKVYPFGLSWNRVEEAARGLGLPVAIVRDPDDAEVDITPKKYIRRMTPRLRNAD